ncbi:hypothetical protein [Microvirga massiliensis]|uniref:hypothetical protein n=1 Tax=Microvirga massiliensis TaxID=1033741 RepID=UPI00062BB143|nr:hypothetical protein [Microvirga massiliensis]
MGQDASGPCTRCKGAGLMNYARAHYGVPGLCFDCDGAGTREVQLTNQAKARAAKALAAAAQKASLEIQEFADRHGGQRLRLPRDKRNAFPAYTVFSTKDYAEKFGMAPKEAFIELARSWPRYSVQIDNTGKPMGWASL